MKGRKIFKQIASIITMVLLLQYVSVLAPLMQVKAKTATVDGIDWTYEIDSNGNAINVKPTNKSQITGNVTIPSELDGHIVTSIGNWAFSYCSSLTNIEIPSSVTIIGDYAFDSCSSLTSIEIPEGVTSIGKYAFSDCSSLTSIEIPEGVTSIGDFTFGWCSNLTSITVNSENNNYTSENGILFNKDKTNIVVYPAGKKDVLEYAIPEGVTSIKGGAFSGCSSLTSIEIPEGVTSIEKCAFIGCSSLTSIEIPDSVTSIENETFASCSSLTNITIPKGVTSIGDYVFRECSSLTSIEIPEGVTSIGNRVFFGCSSLTSIEIPSSVTVIEDYAFYGCSRLTSIEIPEGVTSIGKYAFSDCSSLTSIEIPEGVTSIGEYAFSSCSSLTSIEIPSSVTSIVSGAFSDCSSLTSIEIPEGVTSIGKYAFSGCSSLTSIEIPEGVTSIGDYVFRECSSLTSIEIPSSVTSIVSGAFSGCSSLTSIEIPEGVTSIGKYAFSNCSNLTSIEIPSSVTIIGDYAFDSCSSLTSIEIPNSVTTIGANALPSQVIVICDSDSTAHQYAIDNNLIICGGIRTDENVIMWSYNVVNGKAENLKYFSGTIGEIVTIPAIVNNMEVVSIAQNCFESIVENTVKKIIISDGITSIGKRAFANCSSLTSIIIPRSVTSIGDDAFLNHNDNLVIKCIKGSKAYEYALRNSIQYKLYSEFADINLYNKIKEELSSYIEKFDDEKLAILISDNISEKTSLDISNSNIEDLAGIECFNNLTELNISGNKIEDISKLNEIKTLTSLDLSNNNITNISALSSLTNLDTLNLSNNKIIDITAIENLNIENLNLNSQEIELFVDREANEMPNILKKATDSKYSNGANVTYTAEKCSVQNGKIIIGNEIDDDTFGKVIVNNGIMNGTTCTIKLDTDRTTDYEINEDKVVISTYNNGSIYNGGPLYYSLDSGEYKKYENEILLPEGKHNISVKWSNKEVLKFEADVLLKINAIRKNGKIYIYSNTYNKKEYSLNGQDFTEYTESIENIDAKTIFVKIGENEAKEINIQDIGTYEEYEIYDTKTSNDVICESSYGDSSFSIENAIRKNGKIYIDNITKTIGSIDSYSVFYSYDRYTWKETQLNQVEAEDIGANIIYIKIEARWIPDHHTSNYYYDFNIANENNLTEVTGIYNENGNSYIFSQYRKDILEENDRLLLTNDENKIQSLNEEILDVTEAFGNVLVLKKDGIVYKLGDNYDLQMTNGGTNIIQIDGVYALDNQNNVWKCSYDYNDKTYTYAKCDSFTIEGKIEKIKSVIVDGNMMPYVLYENGKAVVLKDDGQVQEISKEAIDISAYENEIYALEADKVISKINPFKSQNLYSKNIDLSGVIKAGEIPIKINKQGMILTNKGNLYKGKFERLSDYSEDIFVLVSYEEEPVKTGVKKLGDYSYQDENKNTYYLTRTTIFNEYNRREYDNNIVKANKNTEDIVVTKDESNIVQNKVEIRLQVPNGKYTVKLPDGNTSNESNITYEVKENGVYTFEFTDKEGYISIRVVHVTNIQSRKETKVPEVTALEGKIKLESDEKIEYSLDKENWTEYTNEITYTQTVYARIKSDNYECSIIKITIDENGKLNVDNTESREIQDKILTNGVGDTEQEIYEDNRKAIKFALEVAEASSNVQDEKNKNFFEYISDIADNIIYSFSSIDGQYAGCYYDSGTEITYKDINGDVVSLKDDDISIKNIDENNNYIDYAVIANLYRHTMGIHVVEEQDKMYAYIDNKGNLVSNIDIINKAKKQIGETTKYVKIVGDGVTFYILTQEGEVYLVAKSGRAKGYNTLDGNGTYGFLNKKMNSDGGLLTVNVDTVYKLNVNNIVDIYDSCTALTKDGKVVSLFKENEEDTSVVQKLQEQTDKYLIASHLGLKNGKLYNFDDVRAGVEVTAGKIVNIESYDDNTVGIYSERKKIIELRQYDDLKGDNRYISVEPVNEELPEFIDIVEYRDNHLVEFCYDDYGEIRQIYNDADKEAKCLALAKDGGIWAYIGDYVVDTGVNLDYFGPTANYRLNNTEFTNKDINLKITANTTNEIVGMKVKKAEETIDELDKNNGETLEEKTVRITKNGKYEIELTDGKARTYTSALKVANIDKLEPDTPEIEKTNEKIKVIFKDDKEATDDYAKSGIKERLISYDGTNWTKQEQDTYELEASDDNITIYAKTIDNAGNESEIASTTSERGKVTVKYQDTDGNTLKEDLRLTGFVGLDYKVEKAEISGYKFIEVVGNEEGKYTKEEQTVIYKYEKIKEETIVGKVIVKYQDENGNSLKEDLNLTGKVGDSYKVERQEIDLYELTNVEGNEEGKYTKEDQTVIYKYNRISGRIIIIHEDPEGNKIKEDTIITGKVGDPYKVERPTVEEYELIEVIGNEEGTYKVEDQFIRYKYKKIEVPALPQTGQGRIAYLILGIIIIICIGTLIYYKE